MKKSKPDMLRELIISQVGKHNADVEAGWLEGLKGQRIRKHGMLVGKLPPEGFTKPGNEDRYRDWSAGLTMAARFQKKKREKNKIPDPEVDELLKYEECLCKVGSTKGNEGTIERIYRGRGSKSGQIMARVIMMESGSVRNLPFIDIYPR